MRLIHLEPRPVHFPSPTHHHRSSSNNIQQHPTTSNNIQQHPTTGPCSPSRRRCDDDRPRPFRVPFLFCVPFFFFLNFADFSGLSPVGSSFLLIFRNGRQSTFFFRCKPSQPVADRYDADDADADGRWPPQRPAADEIDERNNKQTNTNKIDFFFAFVSHPFHKNRDPPTDDDKKKRNKGNQTMASKEAKDVRTTGDNPF